MRYLMCLVPPVAMLFCGKPIHAVVSLVLMLTVIGWPIMSIWAILVVNSHFADKRTKKLVKAVERR